MTKNGHYLTLFEISQNYAKLFKIIEIIQNYSTLFDSMQHYLSIFKHHLTLFQFSFKIVYLFYPVCINTKLRKEHIINCMKNDKKSNKWKQIK